MDTAFALAQRILGYSLSGVNFKVAVKDERRINGSADLSNPDAMTVVVLPKDTVADFKYAAFHEFGHTVFSRYMARNSVAYKEYYAAAEKHYEAMNSDYPDDSTDALMAHLAVMKATMAVMMRYASIYKEYTELVADLFTVSINKNPGAAGAYGSRDFSKMNPAPDTPNDGDEHHIFNPVRGWLWQNRLKDKLEDSAYLASLNQKTLQNCQSEIDSRFAAASAANSLDNLSSVQVNTRLISLLSQ
jgi:hypothetical protein